MKIKLLVLAIAVCMIATPARADLFGFHLGNLSADYDGTSLLTVTGWASTSGSLYRNIAPTGTAVFDFGSWGTGSESLLVSMTLSSITSTTADAVGTITFKDVGADTFAADVSGTWLNVSGIGVFAGALTDVTYAPAAATFDGHSGDAVDLVFPGSPQPWVGALVQLTGSTWFTSGSYDNVHGGSLDVSVVPVPAAVLLGMLGLGVAGVKLRKFA